MEDFTSLVSDAQNGSPEAFTQLVLRFQGMAYAYACTRLGDYELAQDAAQEAFVEAFHGLPGLRAPLAFPAWLKRIVWKQCDRITRRRRQVLLPLQQIDDLGFTQPGPAELLEREERGSQVKQAVNDLPMTLRASVILFYVGGYSIQEIAAFLGIETKTVKSRLHSARQRLKERMIGMAQDEFDRNPLPEPFTRETVARALKRAMELNASRQYVDAEELLRRLLTQAPGQPDALKELNRAVMRGRVYGQGRWDLLRELAARGRELLQTGNNEETSRQVALTLLAVPALHEAIDFLECWVATAGENIERLGMLAWAKGCSGDLTAARSIWNQLTALTLESQDAERLPFIAFTLVVALSVAGDLAGAQTIAREAWKVSGALAHAKQTSAGVNRWLTLWHTARLDFMDIYPTLMECNPDGATSLDKPLALRFGAGRNQLR